ncbi:MAG: hypothetical protein ACOCVI_02880 [Planctomycetota bacterium]
MYDRRPPDGVDLMRDFCRVNDEIARDIRRHLREAEAEGVYISVPARQERPGE